MEDIIINNSTPKKKSILIPIIISIIVGIIIVYVGIYFLGKKESYGKLLQRIYSSFLESYFDFIFN
jgi:flagellar basal body-associated protein FliL